MGFGIEPGAAAEGFAKVSVVDKNVEFFVGLFDHAGGKAEAVEIGKTELAVAELIRPKLVADGMFLVGIDIVGDKILEVNVFSPGNLGSCSSLAGVDFSVPILEAIERKVAIAGQYAHNFTNRQLAVL